MFLILDQMDDILSDRIHQWNDNDQITDCIDSNDTELSILKEKIFIALQVANALQFMHSHKYIYRDLKPENIGLMKIVDHNSNDVNNNNNDNNNYTERSGKYFVKLFDFGLSRILPSSSSSSSSLSPSKMEEELYNMSIAGTIRHMAPEVSKGIYNCKVDVYSLSLVLFEMLTLKKPYSNYGKQEIQCFVHQNGEREKFDNNDNDDNKYVSKIDPALQNIITESWTQNIWQRYTSKRLYNELLKYYDDIQFQSTKEEGKKI